MSNQKHPSGDGGDQHSEEHHKKESLADQLTGTLTDLTESISQVRSNRRRASMPPTDTLPVVSAAGSDTPPPPKVLGNGKTSMMHNPVAFGFLMTVGVGLALLAYYIFNNVGALVGWVTGAIFIALGLDPIVRRLEAWGIKRNIGVIVVLAGFAGAVTALVMSIGPIISEQATKFVQYAPNIYQNTIDSDWYHELDQRFNISSWVNENVPKFLESTFSSSQVNSFMSSLLSAGSTLAQSVTGVIIVLFLSLYFLTSMNTIKAWGVRLAPGSKRARVKYITDKITDSVGNYVMGQAMVAICNALFAFFTMLFLGFSFPQLMAIVILILAFIPLVGGVVALILTSLILLTQGWSMALWFAVAYFLYLQVEAYLISPRIMARAVSVPAGVAIISVAAGGALWGVLGALIAIPAAASMLILVREVFIPRQDQL
ncbi:AI-2E family transporter [uncultured Rothia sp.]|uniref:AI-2E family transporter n=1 Tax=uncultured Rothia sp. TaxID=316088 RepID=UPI0025FFF257|nr:AI-2E family transporter [uncultured Rothia sp.]